jgi:anti-sigma factor RsiW
MTTTETHTSTAARLDAAIASLVRDYDLKAARVSSATLEQNPAMVVRQAEEWAVISRAINRLTTYRNAYGENGMAGLNKALLESLLANNEMAAQRAVSGNREAKAIKMAMDTMARFEVS